MTQSLHQRTTAVYSQLAAGPRHQIRTPVHLVWLTAPEFQETDPPLASSRRHQPTRIAPPPRCWDPASSCREAVELRRSALSRTLRGHHLTDFHVTSG